MKTSIKQECRRSGFTLVEVMMAICIIGIAFVAVFGILRYGFVVTTLNSENVRATEIMLDKMEGLRLYKWENLNTPGFLATSFTNWFYETNHVGMTNATGSGIQYTGLVQITKPIPYMNCAYKSNIALVTVTVGWVSGVGDSKIPHTRSMSTYYSQHGVEYFIKLP